MARFRTISQNDLDRLGIDDANKLYWDGKPLVTEERIVLARWVNVAVCVGAGATAIIALVELLRLLGCGQP